MKHDDDDGAAGAAPLPERLLTPLSRLGGAISALLILVALGMTAWSVFMRYVLSAPLIWIDDVTGWVLVALISLGTAEALRRGNHIAIDLLTGALRGRARRLQRAWADLSVALFALVLGISLWDAIAFNIDFDAYTSGAVEIEAWIPLAPMLGGAALLGAFAAARLIGRLTGSVR